MAGDWSKLPKWAQQEHSQALGDARYAEQRLAESLGKNEEESDTQVNLGWKKPQVGLPDGTSVNFKLAYGRITVRVKDGHLYVSSADGALIVMPQITNAVTLEVKKRF